MKAGGLVNRLHKVGANENVPSLQNSKGESAARHVLDVLLHSSNFEAVSINE
jgi:hypothetical protein